MKLKNIKELDSSELASTISIFFETSTMKEFESLEVKELFLYRYFGYYQEYYPEYFLVAVSEKSQGEVLGYTCGHPETFDDEPLKKLNITLDIFKEVKENYPAHLHINVASRAQGRGVGSILISALEDLLARKSIKGVHIITAPEARNVEFYERNGFDYKLLKKINNAKLLLMGKIIKSTS